MLHMGGVFVVFIGLLGVCVRLLGIRLKGVSRKGG